MYKLIKPILFKYDPEQAHGMTIDALKFVQRYPKTLPIIKQFFHYENDILTQELSGVRFLIRLVLQQVSINHAKFQKP